jgi:hypothetical protein
MDKIYQSDILRAVYEGAVVMHEVGGISDARMKEYDKMCLVSEAPHVPSPANTFSPPLPFPVVAAS